VIIVQDTINKIVDKITIFLQSGGYPVGFLIIFIESIFPIVPLALAIAMNLIAFGNVAGFIISYIATILGCFTSYMIFYYLAETKPIKKLLSNKKFKIDSLTNTIQNISLSRLTIISAVPFTPAFLINIVAGLTKLPKRKFLISVIVSKLFIVYFWGFIGKSLLESFTDIKTLSTIAVFLIIFYIISKILEKKFDV
jgi:uncharacterized membrane protein YdjX (TVP38/TMEM64 family)